MNNLQQGPWYFNPHPFNITIKKKNFDYISFVIYCLFNFEQLKHSFCFISFHNFYCDASFMYQVRYKWSSVMKNSTHTYVFSEYFMARVILPCE